MKKWIAVLLALMMVFSLMTTAFAAETGNETEEASTEAVTAADTAEDTAADDEKKDDAKETETPETEKTITLTVKTMDNKSLAGVKFSITPTKGGNDEKITGETGTDGIYSVKVKAGKYRIEVTELPKDYYFVELDSYGEVENLIEAYEMYLYADLTGEDTEYTSTLTASNQPTVQITVQTLSGKGVAKVAVSLTKKGETTPQKLKYTNADGKFIALVDSAEWTYQLYEMPEGYSLVEINGKGQPIGLVDLTTDDGKAYASGEINLTDEDYTSYERTFYAIKNSETKEATITVKTPAGKAVPGVGLAIKKDGESVFSGYTEEDGTVYTLLDVGEYDLEVTSVPSGYSLVVTDGNGKITGTVDKKDAGKKIVIDSKTEKVEETILAEKTSELDQDPCKDYTDINRDKWYHDAIDYVLENQLMVGTSATKFSPNTNVTRAMVVQVLYALEGKPSVSGTVPFKDVSKSAWYYQALTWAYGQKLAAGYSDTQFGPIRPVSRQELVTFLRAYTEYKKMDTRASVSLTGYTDAGEISSYAVENVRWAVENGLMTGRSATTLAPKANTTRAEFAQILYKYCTEVLEDDAADEDAAKDKEKEDDSKGVEVNTDKAENADTTEETVTAVK